MTKQQYNQWWADHYLQQEQEELLWVEFVLQEQRQRFMRYMSEEG